MTDFYKKIYGYEDAIQLQDDDIRILEKGMWLQKMNSKEELNSRFYRLDFNNSQLVASTKELRKKEKLCKFISSQERSLATHDEHYSS
jgi:hypothetical protein